MNVLIIYCHPHKNSYTFQVLEQLKNELIKQNWNIDISDLYASGFQTDLTYKEYEREKFLNYKTPVTNDVQHQHTKLNWADCVVFLYPVWWSDCPAKLKGWFDRVFTVGFAYKHHEEIMEMKAIQYGVALCTAGYSNDYLIETNIAQSMQTVMLDDRFGNRFINKEMIILGNTLNLHTVQPMHTNQLKELIEKMKIKCS